MVQYHALLRKILIEGDSQFNERTKNGMIGISGAQSEYDLREGFPLSTTKPVAMGLVGEELFWMLRGDTNIKRLNDANVRIWHANAFQHDLNKRGLDKKIKKHTPEWDEGFERYAVNINDPDFAAKHGDLGPIYGHQWRHWPDGKGGEIDQVKNIVEGIKSQPGSRYHLLSAWNVADLPDMGLGPCHPVSQFNVWEDNLDVNMFQRSCDVYLGVPFNIAQYSLLNQLVANETGLKARKFIHSYGNVHVYNGVAPRSEFLKNPRNLEEFKNRVINVGNREEYMNVREWYIENALEESAGNERKDHIPFVLEQLSKKPRSLPTINLEDLPFYDLIERPASEMIRVDGYDPHKWDSRAEMAA